MKLTIDRADMEYGVNLVMGAVDRKKMGEYTGSILITAIGNNRVELQATDMELWSSIALKAAVDEPGAVVLPADKIAGVVKVCGAGPVAMALDSDLKTVIDGAIASYGISGLEPAEYPSGYSDSEGQELVFSMPAGKMAACLGSVLHAAGNDATKPQLCGVNFAMTETGRLTAVALDGHRLSIAAMDLPGKNILKKFHAYSFTLPAKAAALLARINHTLFVGRVADKNRLYFQSDSISVCSSEICSEYPDYRRVIPIGTGDVITVASQAFIEALESCYIMSDDQHCRINLRISGETIHVSALGTNNVARASVPCLSDCDITISCNSRHLLQALKAINSGEIFIKHFGPRAPFVIIPADHKGWDERMEVIAPLVN